MSEGVKKSKVVKWPKILLLGDSQTQQGYSDQGCWVSLLSHHFQRRCDVVNRGFDGYNVRWLKEMLPSVIDGELAEECVAITLFLGSNDANVKYPPTNHHIPLDEFKSSLLDVCQFILELGVTKDKLIIITPPPVDKELWSKARVEEGRTPEHGLMNEVLVEYAAAAKEAADSLSLQCVDLYSEMICQQDWPKYVCVDGLHLAKAGAELLADRLIPKLEKLCEQCTEIYPNWEVVDNDNHVPFFKPYL